VLIRRCALGDSDDVGSMYGGGCPGVKKPSEKVSAELDACETLDAMEVTLAL
jgi:hypothetical protein